ncbi:hypothetical protein V502_06560 [Pseudogymnoascus sp. VKM F-4520 (FW-2644)]|nr:hypothetical protein V502_06560 [Pseudogymnoascus sp. VKM F-4520 (FW-2644)]
MFALWPNGLWIRSEANGSSISIDAADETLELGRSDDDRCFLATSLDNLAARTGATMDAICRAAPEHRRRRLDLRGGEHRLTDRKIVH